jgi:hypothetical protein
MNNWRAPLEDLHYEYLTNLIYTPSSCLEKPSILSKYSSSQCCRRGMPSQMLNRCTPSTKTMRSRLNPINRNQNASTLLDSSINKSVSLPNTRRKKYKITTPIGISIAQLHKLFDAKCTDAGITSDNPKFQRFYEYCSKIITLREIILKDVY